MSGQNMKLYTPDEIRELIIERNDARAEVARLTARAEELAGLYIEQSREHDRIEAAHDAELARLLALVAQMREHAKHKIGCAYEIYTQYRKCDCGLDAGGQERKAAESLRDRYKTVFKRDAGRSK